MFVNPVNGKRQLGETRGQPLVTVLSKKTLDFLRKL